MSALVRFFLANGKKVAGYDKTPSELTSALISEGADIHFADDVTLVPECCRDSASTLVVYTPAIPAEHTEMVWFRQNGFELQKRAQVLGTLTRSMDGLCVAGTHGKTTTSASITTRALRSLIIRLLFMFLRMPPKNALHPSSVPSRIWAVIADVVVLPWVPATQSPSILRVRVPST